MPVIDDAFLAKLRAEVKRKEAAENPHRGSSSGVGFHPEENTETYSSSNQEIFCGENYATSIENSLSAESTLLSHDYKDKKRAAVANKDPFKKIERLCSLREQSSKVLHDRLIREGFESRLVEQAIDRALACGLLDDMRFADVLVRSRLAAGRGAWGIEAELGRCNISASDIIGWPYDYEICPESELERAIDVLERKPPRAKNAREAAYRRLASKGYASSIASRAARIWSENHLKGD